MGWLKRETAYDRRLRALDEEAERIRKNMQQLMKNVPRDASAISSSRPPSSLPPLPPSRRPSPAAPARPGGEEQDDGFPDGRAAEERPEISPPSPSFGRSDRPAGLGSGPDSARPERLASYLASGSFGKSRTMSRDRRIQRNKAIMMLVFAMLALYSLYTWLK